ncbi:MAG: SpvB/TcaC N-terminal domain-containing protein [Candidatus Omnitrophota bacterium]|nr:SpvB/TcaC N-terminal domain-containing protein [Candidatus Omnitrophota bacterium]
MLRRTRIKPNKTVILGGLVLFFCLALRPAFCANFYSSPDGKVKLIVPDDALPKYSTGGKDDGKMQLPSGPQQQIKILTLGKASFPANAVVNNFDLLIAADLKPDGLTFKKPVNLIFTLPQAEIPGTEIKLALYNTRTKKFVLTGATAVVLKDSYTVIFQITHFSSYAAFKGLTPISTPIGMGTKIPLPDLLTGAFSHSVPLTIPPGRKGMQPSLSLTYRSANPNSWVGLGFSLNPGYIVRSTRLGPPSYNDTQDTFYFVSDAGTTELVHLIDNLYQAKIESSFTKFFKEPDDSWRILGKDGSLLYFGQAPEAKETSALGTFSWYLTKAEDTNANYISFTYIKDSGKCYPLRIDYTGNSSTGTAPTNSIEFATEPRIDITSSYISTARIATARRLKAIEVRQEGALVWTYRLEYDYSPDTDRSLLRGVTQSAADGKSFPEQRFEYQGSK